MGFIRLDGTVAGNLVSASYVKDRFGNDRLRLEGTFDGTNDRTLECPTLIADRLTELGVMGEDSAGVWVDQNKRVAITKTGKGQGNVHWDVADGTGATTQMAAQPQRPQSQRPQQQRPAQSVPQQQQRPTNGQPPQQRPQSATQPAEPPEVTRRRIKATMTFCLREAEDCWAALRGGSPKEVTEDAVFQATAATIFIAYSQRQIPLLADPMAPPPITPEQIAGLKGFRDIWHRIGQIVNGQLLTGAAVDPWFSDEIAKFGRPASLSADQAKQAIDAMAIMIAKRESDIEKAKATPNDPPPPVYTGKEEQIPF